MQASYIEWLNQNKYTRYPFSAAAELTDVSGAFRIPDALILDVSLNVPAENGFPFVYLSGITYTPGLATFSFRSQDDGGLYTVGGCTMNPATHTPGDCYYMGTEAAGTGASGRYMTSRGLIALGDVSGLLRDYDGLELVFNAALLEVSAVRPYPMSVRSLSIDRGTGAGFDGPLQGDVELIAGDNIRLTYLESRNAIRIDAISSRGFNEPDCDCEFEDPAGVPAVRNINGISAQNIILEAGQGIKLSQDGNILRLENTEHEPCCECPELEEINRRAELLEAMIGTVSGYADRANQTANTMAMRSIAEQLGGA